MRSTARLLTTVLASLLAAALLAGCTASTDAPQQTGSEFRFVEGTPSGEVIDADDREDAPNITGELLSGEKFELDQHAGSIVVMNFWASWCAPCRVEAPDLQQIYEQYQPKGVEMIGVLVRDTKGQGQTYSQQVGLTYPSLFDPSTKVALQLSGYPLAAIPSTVVFDADGRVAAAYVSVVDLESLTSTLEKLLAE
jgi:peroxiredoxin